MAQTREEVDRAVQALQRRGPLPACPMCKATSWSVGTMELQPVDAAPVQLVTLGCVGCGFVAHYDLSLIS